MPNINDALVALRQAAAPFAALPTVIQALEEYASLDNWRAEAITARDAALAKVQAADKECADLAAWCAAQRKAADEYAAASKGAADTYAAEVRAAAAEAALKAEETAKQLIASATAEAEARRGKSEALETEVGQLIDLRDKIVAEIAALKERLGA